MLACDSPAATLAAIQAGLGVGFVPLSCQPSAREAASVALGGWHLHLDWYVVGSKDPTLGRAVHECRAFLASREAAQIARHLGIDPP